MTSYEFNVDTIKICTHIENIVNNYFKDFNNPTVEESAVISWALRQSLLEIESRLLIGVRRPINHMDDVL